MDNKTYIKLLIFHFLIGVVLFAFKPLSKVYFISILLFFTYKIVYSPFVKKHIYILMACSYIVGSEVFLRMTNGNFLYETSKYLILLFGLLGFFFTGINKKSLPYIFYLLFLIPGIYLGLINAGYTTNIRTNVAFNLSGPFALGIASIYCYDKKVTFKELNKVLMYALLPLVSTLVYLFLYTPDLRDVVTGTQSNFETSGGFGPNQVSTVLGYGVFILATRYFLYSKSNFLWGLNSVLLILMTFRNIVTFSRGGVITSIFMVLSFIVLYYLRASHNHKRKISLTIIVFLVIAGVAWLISSSQTMGYIDKRYANEDASGRKKTDVTTGRGYLIQSEFSEFLKKPIVGVGVGKIKELRLEKDGIVAASHNELSRILAEHGLLGIIAFLILLITPLVYRTTNRNNIYFYSFYLFWFFTINHSSMRIAAPAFVYALSLLNVTHEKPTLHRQQALKK